MAYGTSESASKRFLNFKIVDKEDQGGKKVKVAPYFSVDYKGEDGKYVVSPDKPKFVAGNLTKIKLGSFKWDENDIHTVQVYLEDGDEVYNVDLRYSLVGRNIFNALLSLETFENIKFSLYVNKAGYAAVGITQNGERVDWKYKLEELPPVERGKVGKKEVVDSSAVDEFFLNELTKLAEKLSNVSTSENNPSVDKEVTPAVEDTDIPF